MKFICMYADYLNIFRDLTDVRRGRLIMAILEYAFSGTVCELRGEERLAFSMMRSQIDRDRQKYEETCQRNRANGSRGGRPRKNPTAQTENPGVLEKPIEKENENVNEKEIKIENEKENEIVKEKESSICPEPGASGSPQPQPGIPDYTDILKYCSDHKLYHVDPAKFYDYYAANGWRMGRGTMADWTAALRSWDHRDAESARKAEAPYAEDPFYTNFKREYGVM